MNRTAPRLKTTAIESAKNPRRSTLFYWLKKNHKQFAGITGERRNWGPVIERAVAVGVTAGDGKSPSLRIMRETWRKVCKQIEAEKAKADPSARPIKPRKLQPRDLPKDWHPQPIVPTTNAPQTLRELLGPVMSGPDLPEPDYSGMDDVERKIARMDWSIKRRTC